MWRQVVSHGDSTIRGNPMSLGSGVNPSDKLRRFLRQGASFSGRERNCCFLNTSGPRFADISAVSGANFADDARALGLSDWDHDGDIDVWLVNRSGPQVRFLRNQTPHSNHFVALKLTGKECNRDAIGARVEVVLKGSPPLIKTLRAGDGFLSQSSKWLHFGLGEASQIERLVVHWPGNSRNAETFSGLEADSHYHVEQGRGKLQRWRRPTVAQLQASPPDIEPASGAGRIFFPSPIPLPRLPFQTVTGKASTVAELPTGPRLVNLWASWCQPCLAELGELSERRGELREAGLGVIALSVDSLGSNTESAERAARLVMERLEFPHAHGFASEELVDNLQLVHDELFDQHRPIPVPASALLDQAGHLVALYKGRLQVDQLLADVKRLDASLHERREALTPFAGKWHGPLKKQRGLAIAHQLLKERKLATAQDYLERHEKALADDDQFPETLVNLSLVLLERGKTQEAQQQLERAAALNPELPEALYNLGLMAEGRGEREAAIRHYRDLLQFAPHVALARYRLAMLLFKSKPQEAAKHIEHLVSFSPDFAPGHFQRAEMFRKLGQHQQALSHYRRASQFDPQDAISPFRAGLGLLQQGKVSMGVESLWKAQRLAPKNIQIQNSLAWILATNSDPQVRDGAQALRLAKQMCEQTEYRVVSPLDTLAAAYAAAGQFEKAAETAKQAERLARATNQFELADRIEKRRQLYQAGRALEE